MKKVFFIGYNKTATKAFHFLFKHAGYRSAHYSCALSNGVPAILAQIMKQNQDSYYPILHGIDRFQIYSDMFWHREDEWIDGIKYYKELYQQYPDAYFVLQTRDVESWLESKRKHKGGAYMERACEYHNGDDSKVLDWFVQDREEHHRKVREYFKENPKFIEFDINEDSIDDLINFFLPDFILTEKHWQIVN